MKVESYLWNFQLCKTIHLTKSLVKSIHQIFLKGFNLEGGWSTEGIERMIKRSTVCGLLMNSNQKICGY